MSLARSDGVHSDCSITYFHSCFKRIISFIQTTTTVDEAPVIIWFIVVKLRNRKKSSIGHDITVICYPHRVITTTDNVQIFPRAYLRVNQSASDFDLVGLVSEFPP